MIVASLAFYLFSFMAIVGALNVIFRRNPVHSVLWLIFTFASTAGLFVLVGAEFLALALVFVYVGAVATLFLFVVMMLDINIAMVREGVLRYLPVGAVIGVILLIELAMAFGGWTAAPGAEALRAVPTPDITQVANTQALGMVLYTKYAYIFQISGLILLVAMIGSIVLTLRRRPNTRRQSIPAQLARSPANTLEVVKVQSGQGVSL